MYESIHTVIVLPKFDPKHHYNFYQTDSVARDRDDRVTVKVVTRTESLLKVVTRTGVTVKSSYEDRVTVKSIYEDRVTVKSRYEDRSRSYGTL